MTEPISGSIPEPDRLAVSLVRSRPGLTTMPGCTMISRNRSIRTIMGLFRNSAVPSRIFLTARRIRSSWEKRQRCRRSGGGCPAHVLPLRNTGVPLNWSGRRSWRVSGGRSPHPIDPGSYPPGVLDNGDVPADDATLLDDLFGSPGTLVNPYDYDQLGSSEAPSTASAFQRPTRRAAGRGGLWQRTSGRRQLRGRRGSQLLERDDPSNPLHADGESRRFPHGRRGRPVTSRLASRDFSRGVIVCPIQLFVLHAGLQIAQISRIEMS